MSLFKFQARSPLSYLVYLGGILLLLSGLLLGCEPSLTAAPPALNSSPSPVVVGKLAEVATPALIEQLRPALEQYQPQVKILSPKPGEILSQTSVAVKLSVQDLPLFQNSELAMGPHLHLILDNQPYEAIYNTDQSILLSDLAPGTHTLRAFPVRPWHESFKNDGAYAQTTFHVLTPNDDNRPNPDLPLLTYSRPKGSYGAEPILLDFYLSNAPLHLVAQEDPKDAIADWRIRVTINNESFLLDHWQPIYLKGFEPGQNWIKLEFIDEQGNPVANTFNNTVRVIDYHPQGQDSLSRLVRGELPLAIAKAMVDNTLPMPALPPEDKSEEPETIASPESESIKSLLPAPVSAPSSKSILPTFEPEKPLISPSPGNSAQDRQTTELLPLEEKPGDRLEEKGTEAQDLSPSPSPLAEPPTETPEIKTDRDASEPKLDN
jgi:hypothetical protein